MCNHRVCLEVIFGDTTRAVATIAMAVQTRKSFVSIAMVALLVETGFVLWMAGLRIVKHGDDRGGLVVRLAWSERQRSGLKY